MTERRRNIETMPTRRTANRIVPRPSSSANRNVNNSSQAPRPARPVNNRQTSQQSNNRNTRVNTARANSSRVNVDKPARDGSASKTVIYTLIKDKGIDFTKNEHDYYVESVLENLQSDMVPILNHIRFPEKLYALLENLVISISREPANRGVPNARNVERSRRRYE